MHGKWPSGDQTESPAFKRWFGESKIVDVHGKPLVVCHGTRQAFQIVGSYVTLKINPGGDGKGRATSTTQHEFAVH